MGPASSPKEVLTQMVKEGVNICRLNFSHGEHEAHAKVIKTIRQINKDLGRNVAILADLQGPKIRCYEMEEGSILVDGKEVIITTKEIKGNAKKFGINYEHLPEEVQPGERILLDDGKLELEVVSTDEKENIKAKVIHGGVLSSRKGVNLPNTKISIPSLTEKDLEDLKFALKQGVDWVALSFVRSARDIIELKYIIRKERSNAKIIAKIEKPEAIEEIDAIIKETDAVMVARGDLGVEIPFQRVPLIQKMIIQKCIRLAKPVIVATQMMESMIVDATPTRAEVNDVANAVMDGADAVMLSGETSVGKYPVEVIKAMKNIIYEMEDFEGIYHRELEPQKNTARFISDSICFNACRLAEQTEADAIIGMSYSGYSAFKMSSLRPKAPIYIFTSNKAILTQLNLVWGVRAFYYDSKVSTDHTIADIKYLLKKEGLISEGDLIINVASTPIEENGKTNMLKLSMVD